MTAKPQLLRRDLKPGDTFYIEFGCLQRRIGPNGEDEVDCPPFGWGQCEEVHPDTPVERTP